MDSYSLMFCVVSSFLAFSGFGLKSPASGFQFYSSNSLKISPIKVNGEMIFHCEGQPKRFTELHEE